MKKLVLILGIVFVTMSSFTSRDYDISIAEENLSTNWCFSTYTFWYNYYIDMGYSVGDAVEYAGDQFNSCVDAQQ